MRTKSVFATTGSSGARALLALALAGSAAGQVTSRVSVSSSGVQGNDGSYAPAITPDGRYVAFASWATNLVGGDANGTTDVFVRDRQSGTTERVSVDSSGAEGNGYSFSRPAISADGRFVAFENDASNLVAGDTNGVTDVFVRDRQSGTTERISVDSNGIQGDDFSEGPAISADGRYVAFLSSATNLVAGGTNGDIHAYVRDRQTGTTEIVSVDSGGTQADNSCRGLTSISPDGRYVAFASFAGNLVAGDTNGDCDAFVRDRQSGTTERVSVSSSGTQGNHVSGEFDLSISADGRYVAFPSFASNLVGGDTNGDYDVFVHDRLSDTTERVSVHSSGAQGNDTSYYVSISGDGRYVAFTSFATNLVAGDTNAQPDTFVRDRQTGTTERVSVHTSGTQGNGDSGYFYFSMSPDGRFVAFGSAAGNLVLGDTNFTDDVLVRDRESPPMTSLCDPGVSGVVACPCSNAPSGGMRGCDNSASTGGASLTTAGVPDLSTDTLVFTTSGQVPSSLSVLVQGDALASSGALYGRGVRCAGGALRTLYAKTATAGSITAPDLGAGDPTVSARSAALGDPLVPGQTRWYFVGYRDPFALCPALLPPTLLQTSNATQTWAVVWQP